MTDEAHFHWNSFVIKQDLGDQNQKSASKNLLTIRDNVGFGITSEKINDIFFYEMVKV